MDKALYTLLLITSGSIVGICSAAAYAHVKLRQAGSAIHRDDPILILLAGLILGNGVLIIRLAQAGTAIPNLAAWLYLVGVLLQLIGMARLVKRSIELLAAIESKGER